jgi:hypothetical protein
VTSQENGSKPLAKNHEKAFQQWKSKHRPEAGGSLIGSGTWCGEANGQRVERGLAEDWEPHRCCWWWGRGW